MKTKLYVLKHPETNAIRYVGITIRSLQERLSGHLSDVRNRPEMNTHKTNWINKILKEGLKPIIELVTIYDTLEEAKQAEIEYIKKYKEEYKLTNSTIGGDHLGHRSHSRETILKKKNTRAISQYNIFGEKLRDFEITEDAARFLNLSSASKITSCCKKDREHAHGYIWRYKEDELGDISNIDKQSLSFNDIVQYTLDGEYIESYDSYLKASEAVGDQSKGGNIAAAAKGRQRTCKGFIWRFEPRFEVIDETFIEELKKQNEKPHEPTRHKGTKIIQLDLEGNELQIFVSASEASRAVLGTINGRKAIIDCCNDKRTEYKNFKWQFCPTTE